MTRIAVVLSRVLSPGEAASVAAILVGQAAASCADLYDPEPLADRDGSRHAAIRYNTVVLEAGPGQLLRFAHEVREVGPVVTLVLFSRAGQQLSNAFSEYVEWVRGATTEALVPVGATVVGDDEHVRQLTRRFSLYNG
jgi:hypothetical protein